MPSQKFNPASDEIVNSVSSNQLRRTTFIPWRLKQAIDGFTFDQVQIIVQKLPYYSQGVNIFCLKFMGSNPPPIYIGDLPCPEHCIPDVTMLPINADTFADIHFNELLNVAFLKPETVIGVALSKHGSVSIANSYTLFLHDTKSLNQKPADDAYITI